MERRNILKGLAAIAALPSIAPPWAAPFRRVRPGDAGWPTAQEWEQLKTQVGGNLVRPADLLSACTASADSADCNASRTELGNPFFIGDQAGGTQVSGWLNAWTPKHSAYAVAAHNAGDVVAAVNFARARKLRLAVKGGGHSY